MDGPTAFLKMAALHAQARGSGAFFAQTSESLDDLLKSLCLQELRKECNYWNSFELHLIAILLNLPRF